MLASWIEDQQDHSPSDVIQFAFWEPSCHQIAVDILVELDTDFWGDLTGQSTFSAALEKSNFPNILLVTKLQKFIPLFMTVGPLPLLIFLALM